MSENPGPYMYVLSQWQLDDLRREWLLSDEGAAAVTAAAAAYHKTECIYGRELTTLREAVDALPIAEFVDLNPAERFVWASDLRAALAVSHVES